MGKTRLIRIRAAAVLASFAVAAGCAGGGEETPAEPSPTSPAPTASATASRPTVVVLDLGDATLSAEVAATPIARQTGLMHRTELAEDAGMLFVFPARREGSFWMKDTLIPLSIAFLVEAGPASYRIVDILDMEPCRTQTCPKYRADQAFDAALEVNEGWFARAGIEVGHELDLDGPRPTAAPTTTVPQPTARR